MTSECEELQNIAVSIMQRSDINVVIDNSLETAMTDYKSIFVTIQLIPPELRKYRRVVSRVLDGQVSHEAGHIVVTAPVKMRLMQWINQQGMPNLANIVHQTLEDKRVNYFILTRYRYDFAFRLQLLADVSNRLWVDSLKAEMAKMRSNPSNAMKPESFFIQQMLIPIAAMRGMWGLDVEKEFDLSDEQKQFIERTKRIFDDARFDRMTMTIVARHQELYNLWQTQVYKTGEDAQSHTPASFGGTLKLAGGEGTKKMLTTMEKSLRKAEQRAKEEADKLRQKEKDISEGMAAGSGSGLNVPTPTPNERNYEHIVVRNREHIERLLNLLKRLVLPKLVTQRYTKQGRFMTEVLGKAFASSTSRTVENVFSRKVETLEKAEACIGLLVDLSGSVTLSDAEDALATISEVCGRWLRDEDFAILVFGSEYQKIKAYVEPYHTTRYRIGGLRCLGGTELYSPLDEMYHMLKAQHNGRKKLLITVSDFWVDKREECKKLYRTIEKDEINIIGLGIDSARTENTVLYCPRQRYIGNITQLPEAVFDLYREAAF